MAFDWFKKKSQQDESEKSRQRSRRPADRDWTESMVANVDMLRGLYHNTYPGLKLAGGLAFPAISVPVYFMGLPIPKTDSESRNIELDALHQRFITDEQQIHIQCHREGTVWVWPKMNQITGFPMWEFIGDDSVVDVVKDIYSGSMTKIYTDEQMTVVTGYNQTQIVRRIREFTDRRVVVRYEGSTTIPGLENQEFRNNLGIMPIPFANNADGGNVRGHSDLERMLPDLKMYHDIELSQHQAIAKFRPKYVQQVADVGQWLANNGFDPANPDIDASAIDVIFNKGEMEKSEFIQLADIVAPYIETKKQTFHKIVQESGVPEICYGLKTEGNHASVEESMSTLAQFVGDKQRQKQEAYDLLWNATLRLYLRANMSSSVDAVRVEWNDMETVSEKVKSEIFEKWATGISAIAGSATGTPTQLWKLWQKNYPDITEQDEQEFMAGLIKMAEHKQFTGAAWDDVRIASGDSEPDEDGADF